jgi:hypothetical protein
MVGMMLVIGCKPSEPMDPRIAELRGPLLLTSEPEAKSLSEVVEKLEAGETLAIQGRIFANGLSPWDPGKATFVLSELPAEGHSDDPDHADNCPFCKRKAAMAPKAMVQFVDKEGSVLPVDARKLFDLKEKDVVVVQGTGKQLEAGLYLFTASGISIRR